MTRVSKGSKKISTNEIRQESVQQPERETNSDEETKPERRQKMRRVTIMKKEKRGKLRERERERVVRERAWHSACTFKYDDNRC